jgi:hypothetical protein
MFDFNNVTSEISNDNDKLSISYLLTQIVPVFQSLYGITLVLSDDKDSINSGIFDIFNVRHTTGYYNDDIPVYVMKSILKNNFSICDQNIRYLNKWENEVFIVKEYFLIEEPFTISIKKNISTEMQQKILNNYDFKFCDLF